MTESMTEVIMATGHPIILLLISHRKLQISVNLQIIYDILLTTVTAYNAIVRITIITEEFTHSVIHDKINVMQIFNTLFYTQTPKSSNYDSLQLFTCIHNMPEIPQPTNVLTLKHVQRSMKHTSY